MSVSTLTGCVAPCGWRAPEDFITIDLAHIGLVVPAHGKSSVLRTAKRFRPRVLDAAVSLELRARAIAHVREYFRGRGGYVVEILHTCVVGDPLEVEVVYRVTAPAPAPREFQWRHLHLPARPRDRRSCRPRPAMPRMGVAR